MARREQSERFAWMPAGLRRVGRTLWRLIAHTVGASIRYRVTGLAAEAAFFTILSLPPLIFGLAGAIGFVAQRFDPRTVTTFREQVLGLASQVLTPVAVDSVIEPTLDDVLSGGRFDIISIGFVIALWSGSRALNVFVDTITIMYGLGGRRGIVPTRALSFLLYVIFLLVGVLLLPLVLAGPSLVDSFVPAQLTWVTALYWPVVLVGSVFVLATLFHLAVPVRTRLRANLPGALLTMLIWLGGSYLLRTFLGQSVGTASIYGPLAAPIALLIWLYVISLAVLIGAAFNAAADEVWPRLSGIPHPDPTPEDPDVGSVLTGQAVPARVRRTAGEDHRPEASTSPSSVTTDSATTDSATTGSTIPDGAAPGSTTAADPAGAPPPTTGPASAAELRARERESDPLP